MPENENQLRYGKCLVEREIGRGARSVVYLAWHEGLQIPVAVKVVKREYGREEDQFSERFTREARIAAQLTHTNIVRVYDCGETETVYYLVLEYIEGESCRDKMEQWGAFDWQRAVQIMREVADGLRYAATKGIIHRDLKPENIMIDSGGTTHLADLGLAKEILQGQASATADGDVLGTPYYMSPEQVRQPSDVDFRSDIYSLGATLYHMATGDVPFEASTPFEIMTKHLNEAIPSPAQRRPDLPQNLCAVIMRMMEKDPNDRYQTYQDLIGDLDNLLAGEPVSTGQEEGFVATLRKELTEPTTYDEVSAAEEGPLPSAAALAGPEPQAPPPPRALLPVELPVTAQDVRAKLVGMSALVIYVLFLLGASHLAGGIAGAAVMAMLVALSVAHAAHVLRTHRRGGEQDIAVLDDRLSSALARLCTRLALPTPSIRAATGPSEACRAYSLLGGRSVLSIPAGWSISSGLSTAEIEALLAHGLAALYTGNGDVRTLLSLPLALLTAERRAVDWLLGLTARRSPLLTRRLAAVAAMGALVLKCALVAVLFVLSVTAGIVGLLFFAALIIAAAFERSIVYTGDAFAAKVLGDEEAVRSLIVATGLSGLSPWRLLDECAPTGLAADWSGAPASPPQRERWSGAVAGHFSDSEAVPSMTAMAQNLFAPAPSTAQRLNVLAGLPGARSPLGDALALVRRLYGGLLGCDERNVMNLVDMATTRFHVIVGLAGAALGITVLAVLKTHSSATMLGVLFAVTVAVLALAAGFVVTPRACRDGVSPGRIGWAVALAGVSLTCASMIGFSLVPWNGMQAYAVMSAIALIPFLLVAAGAAALLVRFGPDLGFDAHRPAYDARSKTAHTVMMLMDDEMKAPTRTMPARGRRPAAPAEPPEGAAPEPPGSA